MVLISAKHVMWETDARAGSSLSTITSYFTQALLQDAHTRVCEINLNYRIFFRAL